MANTPEVDEYLQRTNNLQLIAISIAGNPTIDAETHSMMGQIVAAVEGLLTVLRRLPPLAPPPPPPPPPPTPEPEHQ